LSLHSSVKIKTFALMFKTRKFDN